MGAREASQGISEPKVAEGQRWGCKGPWGGSCVECLRSDQKLYSRGRQVHRGRK